MKYEVVEDFLYVIGSEKEDVPNLAYIFKKGEFYHFSPFHSKTSKEGDMMSEHTLHTMCGTEQVELSMLVIDKETFNKYFKIPDNND